MYSDLKSKISNLFSNWNESVPDTEPLIKSICKDVLEIVEEHEEQLKGCICWCKEDFLDRAEDMYDPFEYSEDEAQEDLEEMINNHDCSIGINWHTVDYYIQERINSKSKN